MCVLGLSTAAAADDAFQVVLPPAFLGSGPHHQVYILLRAAGQAAATPLYFLYIMCTPHPHLI